MLRSWENNQSLSPARRNRWLKMKQRPSPFPWIFALYCFCALQFTPGFPQPVSRSMDAPEVPKSELALCFSQWTELSNQPQISSKAMDLCNAIFSSMQIDEENNEDIYKRFLFHYSRVQEPTYPLKTGSSPVHPLMRLASKLSERRMKRFLDPESQIAAAEFIKKDSAGTMGRPFFLFRPRNGRTIEDGGE
ncbi:neuromedin-S isoform X2 [Caretta caretta]|uniref:neuromedin-S isoform X2 n=1 Tax=Caretta caretta TaxID=8467 RepID=UPI002096349B|nr:neuromedin-S isoform X2 [Caretta caretta]